MIHAWLNTLLLWLNAHPHYVIAVTGVVTFLESLLIFGSIVPGSVFVLAIGGLIGTGTLKFWPTLWVATSGAVLGDVLSFWLGRRYRMALESLFSKAPRLHVWIQKAQRLLQRHGFKSIFIGRFAGPIRAFVPGLAGMSQMPWRWFLLADVIAAFSWCCSHFLPGAILGAMSESIAPHATPRFLGSSIVLLLSAVLFITLIQGLGKILRDSVHQALSHISSVLKNHPSLQRGSHWLAPSNTAEMLEQQLIFLMSSAIFFFIAGSLTLIIKFYGSSFSLNVAIFELFRSLRNPVMDYLFVTVSLFGDKYVFLIAGGFIGLALGFMKQWRLLFIWISLLLTCNGSIYIMKWFTHSLRPDGLISEIEGFSFPSGHSGLFCGFISFWVLVFRAHAKEFPLRLPEWTVSLLVLIPLSRIYLGAHWFTDVWAGMCVGLGCSYLHLTYYLRHPIEPMPWKRFLSLVIVAYLSVLLAYGHLRLDRLINIHTPFYPTHAITSSSWWKEQHHIPSSARKNRWGLPVESFNLEWAGSLDAIKQALYQNGWADVAPEQIDYLFKRWFSKNIPESFHVRDDRHEGHAPVLVFYKKTSPQERLILKLWDNHVFLEDLKLPVWYGTIQSNRWDVETLLNSAKFEFQWAELQESSKLKIRHGYVLKIKPCENNVSTLSQTHI